MTAQTANRRPVLALLGVLAAGLLALGSASPGGAQSVQTIDPSAAIDADLVGPDDGAASPATTPAQGTVQPQAAARPTLDLPPADGSGQAMSVDSQDYLPAEAVPAAPVDPAADASATYRKDDLIGAAEGVFGKGAEGLAGIIEDILRDQGEPTAYIVGREGGGALVFGVRYGSGTLYHKVEGERPVYWTGPSIGFDAGANAGSTFVLVYNLHDSEDLYRRFPGAEGQAYLVGGFTASYLRKGDIVLIPIRAGAGLRLGINAGYMKFSKKQRWLPF